MLSHVYVFDHICVLNIHVYVSYNIIFISNVLFGGRILLAILTFLWEWRSHHPFFQQFCCCWYPRWSLRFHYVTIHSWPQWCWEPRAWPTSCEVAPMTHISNILPSLHGYDATMRSFLRKVFVRRDHVMGHMSLLRKKGLIWLAHSVALWRMPS